MISILNYCKKTVIVFLFLTTLHSNCQNHFSLKELEVFIEQSDMYQCQTLANQKEFSTVKLFSDVGVFSDKFGNTLTVLKMTGGSISYTIKSPSKALLSQYVNDRSARYFKSLDEFISKYYNYRVKFTTEKNGDLKIYILDYGKLQPANVIGNTIIVNSYTLFTHIKVKKGDKIYFKAEGEVKLGEWAGTCGPNGRNGLTNYNFKQNLPHGALIMSCGKSDWQLIGESAEIVAGESGNILIAVNDDDPDNNDGEFIVKFSINKPL